MELRVQYYHWVREEYRASTAVYIVLKKISLGAWNTGKTLLPWYRQEWIVAHSKLHTCTVRSLERGVKSEISL